MIWPCRLLFASRINNIFVKKSHPCYVIQIDDTIRENPISFFCPICGFWLTFYPLESWDHTFWVQSSQALETMHVHKVIWFNNKIFIQDDIVIMLHVLRIVPVSHMKSKSKSKCNNKRRIICTCFSGSLLYGKMTHQYMNMAQELGFQTDNYSKL